MKILFIQFGGSIDKKYPLKANNKEYTIEEPAYSKILDNSYVTFKNRQLTICRKDSLEISSDDITSLHKSIKESEEKMIIVTIGTDRMAEVARSIEPNDKTIVFTGSGLPYYSLNSDASFNVGMAVAAVQSKSAGVYLTMNGQIFDDLSNVFKDPQDLAFKTG